MTCGARLYNFLDHTDHFFRQSCCTKDSFHGCTAAVPPAQVEFADLPLLLGYRSPSQYAKALGHVERCPVSVTFAHSRVL